MSTSDERADAVREFVKRHKRDRGLSIQKLANEIGVSFAVVRGLLGKSTPNEDALIQIERWVARQTRNGDETAMPRPWKSKEEVGRIIQGIMDDLRMTQVDLARALKIEGSQSQVSLWARGKVMPSEENLRKIAALVDEPVEIFREEDEPYEKEKPKLSIVRDPSPPPPSQEEASEKAERDILDQILEQALGLDPWLKLEVMREVASIRRATVAEQDSLAAVNRSKAAIIEARTYEKRTEMLFADAEGSKLRALFVEARRTGKVPTDLYQGAPAPVESNEKE